MTKYFKEYDKRKKQFGIKIEGKRGWYVAPEFDEMGLSEIEHEVDYTWFKKDGKYGYYNIAKKCIEIPAEYGFPFYFNDKGYTVTWKDYKAVVIPIMTVVAEVRQRLSISKRQFILGS